MDAAERQIVRRSLGMLAPYLTLYTATIGALMPVAPSSSDIALMGIPRSRTDRPSAGSRAASDAFARGPAAAATRPIGTIRTHPAVLRQDALWTSTRRS